MADLWQRWRQRARALCQGRAELAFLAPKIVEAILAGSQPPELTAESLAERIDLPPLWTAQEAAVGI